MQAITKITVAQARKLLKHNDKFATRHDELLGVGPEINIEANISNIHGEHGGYNYDIDSTILFFEDDYGYEYTFDLGDIDLSKYFDISEFK